MNSPVLIATHAFAAAVALPLGAWQLFFSTKGDPRHRIAGRVWVALMLYVSVTSFWIKDLRPGEFSLLHVLSVVTIVSVSLGLWFARRGNVLSHSVSMTGSWIGMTTAFAFAVSVPSRDIPTLFVDEPGKAAVAVLAVLGTFAAVLGAASVLARRIPAR